MKNGLSLEDYKISALTTGFIRFGSTEEHMEKRITWLKIMESYLISIYYGKFYAA